MCNLYRMTKGVDEVAHLFDVVAEAGANFAAEVYPGYRGLVVEGGRARAMTWGFPRPMKGKDGRPLKPKAVTNARDDKLGTAFWRDSFANRRCLIPVSAWAEAEGETGRMTRTWYTVPGEEMLGVAGLWRPSAEWGDVYTMVMVDACEAMVDVHDRMPVLLAREDWDRWQTASPEDALPLVRKWDLELLAERTDERWAGRAKSPLRDAPTLL
ncbi:SOS response-associated peptidase [Parablastomonas sp. CN1-191]|uniref:SOS response-associated peptidase n=1 Tax=Parablastomonas sp. CN1-191 TaxID=3400908 RepID=UPI003BF791C9